MTNKKNKKHTKNQGTIFRNKVAQIIEGTPYTDIEEACSDFRALVSFAELMNDTHQETDGFLIYSPIGIDKNSPLLKPLQRLEKSGFVYHIEHPETGEKLWSMTLDGLIFSDHLHKKTN